MQEKDDKIIIWIVSSAISTLIFVDIWSISLKLIGTQIFYVWNFAADYIIQGRRNIESFNGVIIGLIMDYLVGCTNGILIGLILEWRGTKYFWLKGIIVALSNWVVLGVMTRVAPQLFTYPVTPLNFVTWFPAYCLFGALTAYLIVKLSQRRYLFISRYFRFFYYSGISYY